MPQQRPRRRLSPPERREQLLDATLALAAGGDIALVAVQDIAERAGVSEGLLYHYFPTRQAIVAAAVARAAEALLTDLQSADATGGSPRQRLDAALDAYLDHVQAQPTSWRALLAARTGDLADLAAGVEQRSHAWLLDTLGVDAPGPALHVALLGWAALEREACLSWLDRPGVDRGTVKTLLTTTFVAALAAAAEHDDQARRALARLDQTP